MHPMRTPVRTHYDVEEWCAMHVLLYGVIIGIAVAALVIVVYGENGQRTEDRAVAPAPQGTSEGEWG